jgi:hypothetical protein
MEPIFVPAPAKSAFNKNRRVSDLLISQLKHFQHVEKKNGIEIHPALAADIDTEAGAARYIAQITRAIRAQAKPAGIAAVPASSAKPKLPAAPQSGLALAASAEKAPSGKPRKRKKS